MSARISHTNHDHPNTPAARSACRKRMNDGKGPMDAPTERAFNAFENRVATPAKKIVIEIPADEVHEITPDTISKSDLDAAMTRLRAAIAFDGYGVATITSRNEYNEDHTGTYKVYRVDSDGFEVKEYSGMEGFIYFCDMSFIGK